MPLTQTVDIPAGSTLNRRLLIDVPRDVPAGRTVLIFKPIAEMPLTMTAQEAKERGLGFGNEPRIDPLEAIKRCSGITKQFGINLSSDDFLVMCREDKEFENRLDNFTGQQN